MENHKANTNHDYSGVTHYGDPNDDLVEDIENAVTILAAIAIPLLIAYNVYRSPKFDMPHNTTHTIEQKVQDFSD